MEKLIGAIGGETVRNGDKIPPHKEESDVLFNDEWCGYSMKFEKPIFLQAENSSLITHHLSFITHGPLLLCVSNT